MTQIQDQFKRLAAEYEVVHTQAASFKSKTTGLDQKIQVAAGQLRSNQVEIKQISTQLKNTIEALGAQKTLTIGQKGELKKANTIFMQLKDLSGKIERELIHLEKVVNTPHLSTFAAKISGVQELFLTPESSTNYAALRASIPRRADPLLGKVQEDAKVVNLAKNNQPGEISALLTTRGAQADILQLEGPQGKKEYTIWKDSPTTLHLGMDHANWKLDSLVLKKLETAATPYEWMECATKLKTCASVLKNSDTSFCGQQGAIVYISPKTPEAVISSGPHDVLSPSEHWDPGSPIYGAALDTVDGYLNDQKKFRLTFDLAHEIKGQISKLLEQKFVDNPQHAVAKGLLSKVNVTSLHKNYFSEAQATNLEKELKNIQRVLELIPELEIELNISVKDVKSLRSDIKKYLEMDAIVTRGVQRRETTGWEIDAAGSEKTHVLGIEHRTKGQHIAQLTKTLLDRQIYLKQFALPGDSVDANKASEVVKNDKEKYFKNIFRNTIQSTTLAEAVNLFESYAHDPRRLEAAEHVTVSGALPLAPALHGLFLKPSEARAIFDSCSQLAKEIRDADKLAKSTYTEIQLYSSDCEIAGFGIKSEMLAMLKTTSFADLQQKHIQKRADRDHLQQAINDKESARVAANNLLPDSQLDDLKKQLGNVKNEIDQLDGLLGSFRILEQASKMGVPVYVHTGG